MKNCLFILIAVLAMEKLCAQAKIFERKPSTFSQAVEIVLKDYRNNYRNIEGQLLESELEYEHYASTVTLPGSEYCIIGRYHSVIDTSASWQALMYRNEDFESAAKQYKSLFKQLKASPITEVDGSKLYLDGSMETPAEELDFMVTTLQFKTMDRRYQHFKVELEMLYKMNEWIININMITRKPDDEVRPDWMTSSIE